MFEKQYVQIFTFGILIFILNSTLGPNFLYVEMYFFFLLSSSFCSKLRILRKERNLNCSCASIKRIAV